MVFSELIPLSSTTPATHSDMMRLLSCGQESFWRKPNQKLFCRVTWNTFQTRVETQMFKSGITPSDTVVTFGPGNQTKSSLTLNPGNTSNVHLEMSAPTAPILWSTPAAQLLANANRGIHTRTTCWRHCSSKYTAEKDARRPEYEGVL